MHEMSLVDALFDQVDASLRPHPGARLRQLRVRIGELAGVEPELFRTAFEELRRERLYPSSELELTWEPAQWRCPMCGQAVVQGEVLQCPSCDVAAVISRGDGIYLDHLEMEVPDV